MAAAYPQVGKRGTGRRKEAVARVRLLPGTGVVIVNGRSLEGHFGRRPALHAPVMQPLVAAGVEKSYNVLARVQGGGLTGQADAIKLGLARALSEVNNDLEKVMRGEGFMTRDPRAKERKKYGRKKARKRFQFSKR
ncbi:MAG: 30S ribosomal protein S9 [Candidatus Melainabacteria bacterium]